MIDENKEFDVYGGAEELEEADEINEVEEGFMKGYEDGIDETTCSNCNKVVSGIDFIEENIDGKIYKFCSRECGDRFELRKEQL
jgi:hypothetical protein